MSATMSISLGGMSTATRGVEAAAAKIARYAAASSDSVETGAEAAVDADADFAAAAISMKVYQMSFRANAAVVRATDEMLGELLDTLG